MSKMIKTNSTVHIPLETVRATRFLQCMEGDQYEVGECISYVALCHAYSSRQDDVALENQFEQDAVVLVHTLVDVLSKEGWRGLERLGSAQVFVPRVSTQLVRGDERRHFSYELVKAINGWRIDVKIT